MAESVAKILRDKQFRFNKQFGQNFITDTNLLDAMVSESGVTTGDTVVEIGAGAGTLTAALARVANKVVAFEIDNNLKEILALTLAEYDNIEVVFGDFMKIDDERLKQLAGNDYRVVANLPYYITTPIIMRLLESDNPPKSISIMVQKEVAERIVSKAGTEDYGAITASIDLVADAAITRIVKRDMFYPAPNVDSAVLKLDWHGDKYPDADIKSVKKLIKAAFSMRRKTLVNNLSSALGMDKTMAIEAINAIAKDERIRGEALATSDFIKLDNIIKAMKNKVSPNN